MTAPVAKSSTPPAPPRPLQKIEHAVATTFRARLAEARKPARAPLSMPQTGASSRKSPERAATLQHNGAAAFDRVLLDRVPIAQQAMRVRENPVLDESMRANHVESLRLGKRGDEHMARIRVRTARETVEVELVAGAREVTFSFVEGHDQELALYLAKTVSQSAR